MKNIVLNISFLSVLVFMISCQNNSPMDYEIYQSSMEGDRFSLVEANPTQDMDIELQIYPEEKHQTIVGFGGSFTEASAHLVKQLSAEKGNEIIEAYFSDEGARYSLTRTHINSCDFSLSNYSYAPVENDTLLQHFSIEEDKDDIIPMIKAAQKVSSEGFKIISSPWTAPPWMKDNKDWKGGKLLPQYYDLWAKFFIKYFDAYKTEGIDIWGISVENEPLGNDNNWESMHFTPQEMAEFVQNYLGPEMNNNYEHIAILGYDQNRNEEVYHWADAMYDGSEPNYYDGIALHWYASTYDYFPKALDYVYEKAPNKLIIQTEACIDAEVPVWKDDAWYWKKEATDWGFDWAPEDQKYLHPKYAPVHRYAQDIIGCLNHHVQGWVDWNMVLDKQGGPNWAKNWCIAPVIVDTATDEVYYTPLYDVMMHFSKFIRSGAQRIGFKSSSEEVNFTAAQNPDGSIVVVAFNAQEEAKAVKLVLGENDLKFEIPANAMQTLVINHKLK
jgi:glucosylceramidase